MPKSLLAPMKFEDTKKERIVRAEKNIDLQLYHHAFKVERKAVKYLRFMPLMSGLVK